MNVHKNARLTLRGRELMVGRIESGWRVSAAAEAAGVSGRTAYRWLARHRRGERLVDRSSAPRRCPHRLPGSSMAEIERLRRMRMTGPAIASMLRLARSTVGAVLRRLGLGKLSSLDPKPAVIRYERARPGEMIHLDIKKLGRFTHPGHRATRDRRAGRSRHAGWDFLHVCVDDASRLAYTEILPSEGQDDTTAFLERALNWLGRQGIQVERGMTDNGSAYRSKCFAQALRDANVRHVRTRPYTPRMNGKAERFMQTSLREWAYGHLYHSSLERSQTIGPWTDAYNRERPHTGMAGLTPWQRVNNLLGNDS
ncbi:IS481 family transposase [Sphingomonas parva]|uniref:IS481 family transposase n=1 Tax=Sphingomonas parva TaxID=2555898 RepID=A0A4Y8ZWM6_9SPHN|nr:IS481 family transposase [Sphingomonas parva]TFI59762.1 IS481 family transposase [Sphingomonas parva]